jgi:glycosyltransferase involved in cell wall biosynthesis
MRVLAFCDHFSTASSGGAERVAAEVYARLVSRHGVDLTVLSVLGPGHEPVRVPGARIVAVPGRDLSGLVGAEMLLAPGLGRRARALHDEVTPDVLHANGLHFQGTAVAARLARRTGTTLVSTAHLGDLSRLSPRLRLGGTVWDATLGTYVVRSSAAMVGVSAAVADHLGTLGARPGSVVVAPNGVDHDSYHARGRRPVGSAGPLEAVFVGRLIENKGPYVALEALAGARARGLDVRLTVLGDGPLRGRLEAHATTLGIRASVTWHGHVTDVPSHLRRADVLLRPSFTEGLPLAVLEAMACGLPVICSTVPGNTEVVRHDRNGLHTPPGSARAVAHGLVALAHDRARLRALAAAAVTTAAAYTWDRSAAAHYTALRAAARIPATAVLEST